MSKKEANRHHVIRNVLEGRLSQAKAAQALGRSERQIRRLCRQVEREGAAGVVHKLRGRPSNHQLDQEALEQALCALHDPLWHRFKPKFAREKLLQYHGIAIGRETLRQLMIQADLWRTDRPKPRHRSWRARRPCRGMLVQLDGSPHDWFEGRGPRCTLLIFIDDATSEILCGEFVDEESTDSLMRATWSYVNRWGRPLALYVDKDSIYKTNRQANVDEELRDEQPATQYKRAMDELGIEVIWANSPQAKGRVERGFLTHQDRLVNELRLRGISNMKDANEFIWGWYIPDHNKRCAVVAAEAQDAHRPVPRNCDLAAILSVQSPRCVQNDYTIQFEGRHYQIEERQSVVLRSKNRVVVQKRLDGSLRLVFKGHYLNFRDIPKRQGKPRYATVQLAPQQRDIGPCRMHRSIPKADHPWRRPIDPVAVFLAASKAKALEDLCRPASPAGGATR